MKQIISNDALDFFERDIIKLLFKQLECGYVVSRVKVDYAKEERGARKGDLGVDSYKMLSQGLGSSTDLMLRNM